MLVVGINSDESVRRLKGDKRPIVSLENRILMLEAIDVVDYIVPFSSDTPYEIIKSLIPSVLVKGSDYKNKTIAGEDIVHDHGGVTELIDMKESISTTALIKKIYECK